MLHGPYHTFDLIFFLFFIFIIFFIFFARFFGIIFSFSSLPTVLYDLIWFFSLSFSYINSTYRGDIGFYMSIFSFSFSFSFSSSLFLIFLFFLDMLLSFFFSHNFFFSYLTIFFPLHFLYTICYFKIIFQWN